ncbi:hypothetical protein [Polyangium sp. y55x31]|uniref:hypothetical protein n=1 Tax=Polyangium sp. y55x31 TaxID=3042688 RepID=UPI0024825BC4|nr:hypothetical protein [Polyangium sp. y55x31]MDI1482014.1 hypothetical protein [Polyangium sp. y55x31]
MVLDPGVLGSRPSVVVIALGAIRNATRADLQLAEKAVLLALALRMDHEGIARTNHRTIAGDLGTSKSVVVEVVAFLRKIGVLLVEGPTARRPVMAFRIALDVLGGPSGEPRRRVRARRELDRPAVQPGPPSGSGDERASNAGQSSLDRPAVQEGGEVEGGAVDAWTARQSSGDAVDKGTWTARQSTLDRPAVLPGPPGGSAELPSLSLSLDLDPDRERQKENSERGATKPGSSKRRARGAAQGEAAPGQMGLVSIASTSDEGGTTKRRKPLTPLPDGWAPSPGMRQWALAQAIQAGLAWTEADVEHESATFCSKARAKDQRWADWGAAWENWIRMGIKFAWKQGKTEEARSGGPGPRRAVGAQPLFSTEPIERVDEDESAPVCAGGNYL